MSVRPGTVGMASGRVLVTYATRLGSTREAAQAVASGLRAAGLGAEVKPAKEVHGPAGYEAVVVGSGLYVGRWHKEVRGFLSRHRQELAVLRWASGLARSLAAAPSARVPVA